MLTVALVVSLLPTLAVAQGYGAPNPTPTSAAVVAVPSAPADTAGHMNVDVFFQGQFVFHPANLTAPNGTLVTFWFPNAGTHSVTQSSFAAPCTYLAATSNSSAGFDSGLQSAKSFTINITNDAKPIWYHCKQITHCGMGMVGSINAPATGNTFDKFVAAAKAIGGSEVAETDNGPVTGGVNGIATAAPASGTSSAGSSGEISVQYSAPLALFAAAVAMGLSFV